MYFFENATKKQNKQNKRKKLQKMRIGYIEYTERVLDVITLRDSDILNLLQYSVVVKYGPRLSGNDTNLGQGILNAITMFTEQSNHNVNKKLLIVGSHTPNQPSNTPELLNPCLILNNVLISSNIEVIILLIHDGFNGQINVTQTYFNCMIPSWMKNTHFFELQSFNQTQFNNVFYDIADAICGEFNETNVNVNDTQECKGDEFIRNVTFAGGGLFFAKFFFCFFFFCEFANVVVLVLGNEMCNYLCI